MRGKSTQSSARRRARRHRAGQGIGSTAVFGLLVGCLSGAPVAAGADEGEVVPPPPRPVPVVPLDRLFELPSGFEPKKADRRGGVSEAEWRTRFGDARASLTRSERDLDASKRELAEMAEANGGWGVAPPVPGMQARVNDAPMNYELSQRIRKAESAVDSAKRRLTNLEVEANLAGVPEDWRR